MFGKKIPSLSASEINTIKNKRHIIDVRHPMELDRFGKLKGTRNIIHTELIANPEKYLKQEEDYYILCQTGIRSKRVCKKLIKKGYKGMNIKGGYMGYSKGV